MRSLSGDDDDDDKVRLHQMDCLPTLFVPDSNWLASSEFWMRRELFGSKETKKNLPKLKLWMKVVYSRFDEKWDGSEEKEDRQAPRTDLDWRRRVVFFFLRWPDCANVLRSTCNARHGRAHPGPPSNEGGRRSLVVVSFFIFSIRSGINAEESAPFFWKWIRTFR